LIGKSSSSLVILGLLAAGYYGDNFLAECDQLRRDNGNFSPKVQELEDTGKNIL
jgi:hypothetical protein